MTWHTLSECSVTSNGTVLCAIAQHIIILMVQGKNKLAENFEKYM